MFLNAFEYVSSAQRRLWCCSIYPDHAEIIDPFISEKLKKNMPKLPVWGPLTFFKSKFQGFKALLNEFWGWGRIGAAPKNMSNALKLHLTLSLPRIIKKTCMEFTLELASIFPYFRQFFRLFSGCMHRTLFQTIPPCSLSGNFNRLNTNKELKTLTCFLVFVLLYIGAWKGLITTFLAWAHS